MKSFLSNSVILTAGLVALLASAGRSAGVVKTYTATFEVAPSFEAPLSPAIMLGDRFTLTYVLDHDDTDSRSSTSEGAFTSAATFVSLTRDATNIGTWNPAGGTATIAPYTLDDQPVDVFDVTSTSLVGFPTANGAARVWFSVFVEDYSKTAVDDSGAGQTLENQLHGAFDPDAFSTFQRCYLTFANGKFLCPVTSYSAENGVAIESARWAAIKSLYR